MKIRSRGALARLLGGGCASALIVALTGAAPASGTTSSPAAVRTSALTHCHAAQTAGSGGFLGSFRTVCQVASTVPSKGDLNPYGMAVVQKTVGNLTAGDVLISNFNNSHNLQE